MLKTPVIMLLLAMLLSACGLAATSTEEIISLIPSEQTKAPDCEGTIASGAIFKIWVIEKKEALALLEVKKGDETKVYAYLTNVQIYDGVPKAYPEGVSGVTVSQDGEELMRIDLRKKQVQVTFCK